MTAPLREQQIVLSDGAAVVSVTIEVHDYFALTGDDRDLLSDIVEIVQAANAKPEDEEPRLRVVPSTEVLEEIDSLAEFVDGLAEEPRGRAGPGRRRAARASLAARPADARGHAWRLRLR